MILDLEQSLQEAVAHHVRQRYGQEVGIVVEQPKQSSFGEFALPVAFQLARTLKKSPKAIAEELAGELPSLAGIRSFEVAGNGYLNVRLDRGAYAAGLMKPVDARQPSFSGKIIVEHTNINPNKAAHIGHLRNAVLGDTFVRMLRSSGHTVEVQNYIDNTGVQVADVVVGFHFLERKTYDEVADLARGPRFDYYCWDLYARISQYYKDQPESLHWRHQTMQAIEQDAGQIAALGHLIADAIVERHLATMLRLGVTYDVLPRESEILHLRFWAQAFELLKQRGAIHFETEGKNAGCWVMRGGAFSEHREDEDSKVIVRSNGTVTYVGKDIAYQLWKFGLLGKDFFYRVLRSYPGGHALYVSTAEPHPQTSDAPQFGRGAQVYNVIDSRQSYLQDVVAAGLRALGFQEQAERSVHFSYEMVALSPRTCVELNIELSEEDRQRPYIEVSGRKGLGVKADDLIDKLIYRALEEVESRHPDRSDEQRRTIATQIAVGALRYFMLKFTRNSVIAFDLQEALSFEGETGPYVQYAAVRASNILRKQDSGIEQIASHEGMLAPEVLDQHLQQEEFWQLLLAASRADFAVSRAVTADEPAAVSKYAFQLAQLFNGFYHDHPVLQEPDPERRTLLLWLTRYVRQQLGKTLLVLGIDVPEYM